MTDTDQYVRFYDAGDEQRHGFGDLSEDRERLGPLLAQVPDDLPVVEVGCGSGRMAGLHPGWLGLDLGHETLARNVPGRSVQGDACELPLADDSVAALFSLQALEHVPEPEVALAEIDRVLMPGGLLYLHPAWHCSQWPMHPLNGRPYGTLSPTRRAAKMARTLVHSRLARAPRTLWRKARAEVAFSRARGPLPLHFGRLTPNLEAYDVPDADASSSLEPTSVATWYLSRGYRALSFGRRRERLLRVRGPVVVRKPRRPDAHAPPGDPLRCPECRGLLVRCGERMDCRCGLAYPVEAGVPRLIRAHRLE